MKKSIRKIKQVVLMVLVLGLILSSLYVVLAEPENVCVRVAVIKHKIEKGAAAEGGGDWPELFGQADIYVSAYWSPVGANDWTGFGSTAIETDKDEYTYDPPRFCGEDDIDEVQVEIRIEVWDDDLEMPTEKIADDLLWKEHITYNVRNGTWNDAVNHRSTRPDGSAIYFTIFPHWINLTLNADPIKVAAGESIKINGSLTTEWDGLTSGLITNVLKITNEYYNREIELYDWNVDTGELTEIKVNGKWVKTASDGSYSINYSFTSTGLHEIQAIFQGDDDFAGNFARTKVCVGRTVETTDLSTVDQHYKTVNQFSPEDDMYVKGCGYLKERTYDLHVVEDTEWSDGMNITDRVIGTEISITTDDSGDIDGALAWASPLVPGRYDIIIDIDGDGIYDEGIDALDDDDIEVTAGFFVIPEMPFGIATGIITLLMALALFRKIRSPLKTK